MHGMGVLKGVGIGVGIDYVDNTCNITHGMS